MAGEPTNKVYMEPGGDRQVIASGGSSDVESGGEIDIESGGAIKIAGVAITSSAAELNKLDGVTSSVADLNAPAKLIDAITVAAANGAANTVDFTITFKDPDGVALMVPTLVFIWISDNANGLGGSVHTHSTGPAFTTGAIQVELITADAWLVLTDASGVAVLRLVDTANEDVTVNAGVMGTALRQSAATTGLWS